MDPVDEYREQLQLLGAEPEHKNSSLEDITSDAPCNCGVLKKIAAHRQLVAMVKKRLAKKLNQEKL